MVFCGSLAFLDGQLENFFSFSFLFCSFSLSFIYVVRSHPTPVCMAKKKSNTVM